MLAAGTSAAAAQQPRVDSVLGRIPAGTRVRVELRDARRISGWLAPAAPGSFALAAGADSAVASDIAFDDVTRVWRRGRAIGTGAIAGGALGAGFGAFIGIVVRALCEYSCGGSTASSAAIGAVAGGISGAAAGSLVGAAFPRWRTVWHGTPAATGPVTVRVDSVAPALPRRRHIGEVTFEAVGGAGHHPGAYPLAPRSAAMGGVAISLAFRAGRFAFGPEYMHLDGPLHVTTYTWLARYDLRGESRLSPYALASIGGYKWTMENFENSLLTGSLGAGVTTAGGWRLEARWHPTLQVADAGGKPGLVTLAAGRRFRW